MLRGHQGKQQKAGEGEERAEPAEAVGLAPEKVAQAPLIEQRGGDDQQVGEQDIGKGRLPREGAQQQATKGGGDGQLAGRPVEQGAQRSLGMPQVGENGRDPDVGQADKQHQAQQLGRGKQTLHQGCGLFLPVTALWSQGRVTGADHSMNCAAEQWLGWSGQDSANPPSCRRLTRLIRGGE